MEMKILFRFATLINMIFMVIHYRSNNTQGLIMTGIFALIMAIWSTDNCNINKK